MDDGLCVRMTVHRNFSVTYTSPHVAKVICHELIKFISMEAPKRNLPKDLFVTSYLGSGASAAVFGLRENLVFKSYHDNIPDYIKLEELEILKIIASKATPLGICTIQFVESYLPLGVLIRPLFSRVDWLNVTQTQMSRLVETFEWLHKSCELVYQEVHDENIMLSSSGELALVDFGCAQKIGAEVNWRGAVPFASIELLEADRSLKYSPHPIDDLRSYVQFVFFVFRPSHQRSLRFYMADNNRKGILDFWQCHSKDGWLEVALQHAKSCDYRSVSQHILMV